MSSPDDCYVDQTGIIGGGDGNPFTLSQVTSGKMLTNLQFWRDSQTIRGVRMTYNTGESILRGSSDDNPDNYGMIDIALVMTKYMTTSLNCEEKGENVFEQRKGVYI
jgi:hypothetical protein